MMCCHTAGPMLCLIHKGKPTHHKIDTSGGKFKTGPSPTYDSLAALVEGLSKPGVPKWPTPLSIPVLYTSDVAGQVLQDEAPAGEDAAEVGAGGGWLHEVIEKEVADELLAGSADGTFLVRAAKTVRKLLFVLSPNCLLLLLCLQFYFVFWPWRWRGGILHV
jgi:hypothetical protein